MNFFLRSLLLVVSCGCPWVAPNPQRACANDASTSPNVLIIMCDQLNASVLSCYGGPVATPHIDRIAAEGVICDSAVCPTPFCSPTRASIITGLYPHTHGIVTNIGRRDYPAMKSPPTQEGIRRRDVTTERLLFEAGYETHHYGKWHLMDEDLPYYTDMYGEHHEYAAEMAEIFAAVRQRDPATWMDWYGWILPVEQSPEFLKAVERLNGRWDGRGYAPFITKMGRLALPLKRHFDVRVAEKTIEAVTRSKDRPFMITCSFNAPHDPNVVPSPYYEAFDPATIRLPANFSVRERRFETQWSRRVVADLGEPGVREFLRIYYGMVKLIDDQVGRILDSLDRSSRMDNTVIVFTADHGDMAGGHGMVWKSTDAFYDEVARVPLIIRYPRILKPQRCSLAVDLTDLMPTLLALVGHSVPEAAQGQNLVPFLTGAAPLSEARPYAFSERIAAHPKHLRKILPGTKGSFMVRGQGWKYVRYRNGDEYLYDLTNDPGETRNVIADRQYANRKAKMRAALVAWLERTAWPGEMPRLVGESSREKHR